MEIKRLVEIVDSVLRFDYSCGGCKVFGQGDFTDCTLCRQQAADEIIEILEEKDGACPGEQTDSEWFTRLNQTLQNIQDLLWKSLLLQAENVRSLSLKEQGYRSWDSQSCDLANRIIIEASRRNRSDK